MRAVQLKDGTIRVIEHPKGPSEVRSMERGVWLSPLLNLLDNRAILKIQAELMWGGTNRVPLCEVARKIDDFYAGR